VFRVPKFESDRTKRREKETKRRGRGWESKSSRVESSRVENCSQEMNSEPPEDDKQQPRGTLKGTLNEMKMFLSATWPGPLLSSPQSSLSLLLPAPAPSRGSPLLRRARLCVLRCFVLHKERLPSRLSTHIFSRLRVVCPHRPSLIDPGRARPLNNNSYTLVAHPGKFLDRPLNRCRVLEWIIRPPPPPPPPPAPSPPSHLQPPLPHPPQPPHLRAAPQTSR
jgi:hypothetical protein